MVRSSYNNGDEKTEETIFRSEPGENQETSKITLEEKQNKCSKKNY